jgi:hypothetical protein
VAVGGAASFPCAVRTSRRCSASLSILTVGPGQVFEEVDGHGGQILVAITRDRTDEGQQSASHEGGSRTTTRDDVATKTTQDRSEELLLRVGCRPGCVGMTVVPRGIKDEDHLNHPLRAMCRGSVRVDILLMVLLRLVPG